MVLAYQVTGWAVKPGGMPKIVEAAAKAARIHRRQGAIAAELFALATTTAGPTVLYSLAFPSLEAWGAWSAAALADPEWSALWAEISGPDAGATMTANIQLTGLGADDPGPAGFVAGARIVRVFNVAPGRGADALAVLEEARGHAKRMGVPRARLALTYFAGQSSGQAMWVYDFANMADLGRHIDGNAVDAAFQSFVADRLVSASSPLTLAAANAQARIPLG